MDVLKFFSHNKKIKKIIQNCVFIGFLILSLPPVFENRKIQDDKKLLPINLSAALSNYTVEVGYTYTWIDASNGTVLSLGSNDFIEILLPINFTFYDGYFTSIYVTTEGYISFKKPQPIQTSGTIPSTSKKAQNVIAPYWTNLDGTTGNIYVKNFSSYWVVAWENINHSSGLLAGSFEVILYNNGNIIFNYGSFNNIDTHACGLNYGDGSYYNSYTGLTNETNNFALKFSHSITDGVSANGGVTGNGFTTVILLITAISIGAVLAGVTINSYKKNPENFKLRLTRTKQKIKEKFKKEK